MPTGFSDLREDDVLTAQDVAHRMMRPNWAALASSLRRAGITPPPRIAGSRLFRGRDVLAWFDTLPSAALSLARCEDQGGHLMDKATALAAPPVHRAPSVVIGPDELERRRAAAAAR